MGTQDTSGKENVVANPTDNPTANPNPTPDPVAELAELQRKNKELADALSQKESYIKSVETEKSTLEARLNAVHQPQTQMPIEDREIQSEATRILETATLDPAKAGEELSRLIKNVSEKTKQDLLSNISPIIEQNTYISKIKEDNRDMVDLGLEPAITERARNLMSSGKGFKDSIDIAVKEVREKFNKIKSNVSSPPPAGSQAETGANVVLPLPQPPREISEQERLALRKDKRRKQGLG